MEPAVFKLEAGQAFKTMVTQICTVEDIPEEPQHMVIHYTDIQPGQSPRQAFQFNKRPSWKMVRVLFGKRMADGVGSQEETGVEEQLSQESHEEKTEEIIEEGDCQEEGKEEESKSEEGDHQEYSGEEESVEMEQEATLTENHREECKQGSSEEQESTGTEKMAECIENLIEEGELSDYQGGGETKSEERDQLEETEKVNDLEEGEECKNKERQEEDNEEGENSWDGMGTDNQEKIFDQISAEDQLERSGEMECNHEEQENFDGVTEEWMACPMCNSEVPASRIKDLSVYKPSLEEAVRQHFKGTVAQENPEEAVN